MPRTPNTVTYHGERGTQMFNEQKLKLKEQECERLAQLVQEAEEAPTCFHCEEEPCIRQERDKYKQALTTIEKYCAYLSAYNKANKTNKGLDIEEVLNIINEVKGD